MGWAGSLFSHCHFSSPAQERCTPSSRDSAELAFSVAFSSMAVLSPKGLFHCMALHPLGPSRCPRAGSKRKNTPTRNSHTLPKSLGMVMTLVLAPRCRPPAQPLPRARDTQPLAAHPLSGDVENQVPRVDRSN